MAHPRPRTLRLSSPAHLRALSSATRQEIVDTLASAGPSSVAALAGLMGRRPDALSFHLRALERAGLVVPDHSKGSPRAANNGVRYRLPAQRLTLDYSTGRAREITRIVRTAVRLSQREFDRACAADPAPASATPRRLWGGRVMGWVDHRSLVRVNGLLEELHAVLRAGSPGPGRSALSFGFILAPAAFGDRDRGTRKHKKEKP